MTITNESIGLIACDGSLPLEYINEAFKKNVPIIVIALTKDIANNIKNQGFAKKIHQINITQIETIIQTLLNEKTNKVVMLGKFNKAIVFQSLKFDKLAQSLLKKLSDFRDKSFMGLIIDELEKRGLKVANQSEFLTNLLIPKSVITINKPTENEWNDIYYGIKIAKEIARMDIGQTIIVKNQTVIAVEALEGTDAAILRSGKIIKNDGIVIKVSRPDQDLRYDIPTVGINTLKAMKKSDFKILAIEANKTFLIDKSDLVKFANNNNMCIVAEDV